MEALISWLNNNSGALQAIGGLVVALGVVGTFCMRAFKTVSSKNESPSARVVRGKIDNNTIAVLPFACLATDVESEHFADSLVEDLITDISKLGGLKVVARNSSFAYKNQSPDIREVGTALGAGLILEGSIRRAGNAIRVTGQLIEASSGHHLWADRYDRSGDLNLALQDEINKLVLIAIEQYVGSNSQTTNSEHREKVVAAEIAPQLPSMLPRSALPPTCFAENGDIKIAYSVMGKGPPDIMYVPGIYAQLELMLQIPAFGRNYQAIAEFSRLIRMDKRGQGLSDPILGKVGLEERTEDVRAVMDAAGSTRAVLIGYSESGSIAINYAVKYPERLQGLILWGAFARNVQGPDCNFGVTPEVMHRLPSVWGTGDLRKLLMPGLEKEGVTRETFKALERMSASAEGIQAAVDFMAEVDVRHLLSKITVPTLIIHYTGDAAVPIEGARYMAEKIPGARLVEIAGVDHASFDGDGLIVGAIRDFCATLTRNGSFNSHS